MPGIIGQHDNEVEQRRDNGSVLSTGRESRKNVFLMGSYTALLNHSQSVCKESENPAVIKAAWQLNSVTISTSRTEENEIRGRAREKKRESH